MDYLEEQKELNKKSYIYLRIRNKYKKPLKDLASDNELSLNTYLTQLLRKHLQDNDKIR